MDLEEIMREPEVWEFDVFTSPHDDVKAGVLCRVWSRVLISREAFPSSVQASETAAVLACSIHGGMPTSVLPRI